MGIRQFSYRWHEPWCQWLQSYDSESEFEDSLEKLKMLPTHIPEDVIKELQVKEAESIENLSIEELSTLIDKYQRATRELHVREYVVRKKLGSKLSSLTDDEVKKHITRVPPAETELRQRRERDAQAHAGDRASQVRKPNKGRPKFEDKLEALKLTNSAFASFLDGLGPAKK